MPAASRRTRAAVTGDPRIADVHEALEASRPQHRRHREDFESLREEAALLVGRLMEARAARRRPNG